jgi:hypothetical protein
MRAIVGLGRFTIEIVIESRDVFCAALLEISHLVQHLNHLSKAQLRGAKQAGVVTTFCAHNFHPRRE